MLAHEWVTRQFGQTLLETSIRSVGLPRDGRTVSGYECSILIGARKFIASDTSERRAKQKACVRLLVEAHPEATFWRQILELYSHSQPYIPSRSQAAEALLRSDRFTMYGASRGPCVALLCYPARRAPGYPSLHLMPPGCTRPQCNVLDEGKGPEAFTACGP
jgi:hypothetical protein